MKELTHFIGGKHVKGASGRFAESFNEIAKARNLDPLNLVIGTDEGLAFYWAGDYDRALARLRATLELEPSFPLAHVYLGLARLGMGDPKGSIAELESARTLLGDDPDFLALWGSACAQAGRTRDAEGTLAGLESLSKRRWVSSFPMAFLLLKLGEKEKAIDRLERCLKEREGRLVYLEVEHAFDPIRGDPRFQEIVRRQKNPA